MKAGNGILNVVRVEPVLVLVVSSHDNARVAYERGNAMGERRNEVGRLAYVC